MEKVFLDADIVLDFLGKRKPFHRFADQVFQLSDDRIIEIMISSLSFSHIHYLLSKQIGREQTLSTLKKFNVLVNIASVNDRVIDLALASDFKDFEDAIQYFSAIEASCSTLLTRNLNDYKSAKIPVMTAESFVKLKN